MGEGAGQKLDAVAGIRNFILHENSQLVFAVCEPAGVINSARHEQIEPFPSAVQGLPLVAMHWEHRFNRMVRRYNDIFRVQMPNITPHVCRHTYCSNQARAGMNPKTLQYLMGHSDISVTMNVYTHLGLEDAAAEMARMKVVEEVRQEQEKVSGKTGSSEMTQKMFRVI